MNVGTELFVWCEWSYNLHSNLIQRSVWLILRTFIIIIIIIKHEKLCYVFFFYYSWLRHPRIRENWKTVTAAFLLFVAGIGMKIRFQVTAFNKIYWGTRMQGGWKHHFVSQHWVFICFDSGMCWAKFAIFASGYAFVHCTVKLNFCICHHLYFTQKCNESHDQFLLY